MPNQVGNDAQTIANKKKTFIPMPKQQTGKGVGAQIGKTGVKQPYNPSSQDLLMQYGDISDKMPYAGMTGNSSEAQANPLPYYGNTIPLPMYVGQRRFGGYDPSMMAWAANLNALGESYGYDMRDPYDSRLGTGNNATVQSAEDGLLPDNFQFMYPEGYPGVMDEEEGGVEGGGGYGGYGDYPYIPLPDYSWGGGGYGGNKGYRDSGLVNWRI